ncbi:MAG: endolytic transglycosylase MltG [Flavisolibacter sp.]
MKKILIFLLIVLIIGASLAAWIFLGSTTSFEKEKSTLYISSKAPTRKAVLDSLRVNKIVTNETAFEFLAKRLDYWNNIKPGKYDFDKGSSMLTIIKTLKRGIQSPVNLVITKLRTKEDFARLVGNKFEIDSVDMLTFLNSSDSLKNFDATPEISMWNVIPDTYTYNWTASPQTIYQKIFSNAKKFWDDDRKLQAQQLGLTPLEVYILASIIEEETTYDAEKDTIASVYLNRLKQNMPLQADPTLKFAAKDFSLKVIRGAILDIESPYNTYRNPGLPPGPISTPSKTTINAVLNPANTDFLFFVARPNLKGHLFSVTFDEHKNKANDYRAADRLRQENEKNAGD